MEMLKFPSDFNINSAYYELEETADGVMKNINELLKFGEKAQLLRDRSERTGSWRMTRRQRSLSEPSLGAEDDVAMDMLLESHHGLPQSPLLGSKVMEMRPESVTSQSSASEYPGVSTPPVIACTVSTPPVIALSEYSGVSIPPIMYIHKIYIYIQLHHFTLSCMCRHCCEACGRRYT